MKVFKTILSSFCAIIIIICSIAQFHHHDENGKMVIFYCSEHICGNHHFHTTTDGINQQPCTHGCNDGHHQDEKNCSLKINIAKNENKNLNQIIISCIIINDITNDLAQEKSVYFCINDIPLLYQYYTSSCGLRAPPIA